MNSIKLSSLQEKLILAGILLYGLFLRVYKFPQIGFTHDELSALTRLHHANLSDLLEKGVKIDGHPAGAQVLLYYWTGIFGESEIAVKLPFIVFGLASIYLIYLIAKRWFSSTSGLLAAAIYSVIQYSIYHDQTARPYAMGAFFVLFAFWAYGNLLVADSKKQNILYSLLYAIGLAGSAYSHHFAAFAAALVAVTGFIYVRKYNILWYFGACALATLLYLPHLSITLYQLKIGGIGGPDGWLAPPTPEFITNYFYYLFHFSWLFLAPVIAVIFFYFFNRGDRKKGFMSLVMLLWFLITITVAYIYSIKVNPLLQFSTLFFVFPFLLIAALSVIPEIKPIILYILIVVFLGTGTYTLVKGRKHYEMMLNQPYDYFAKNLYTIAANNSGNYLALNGEDHYLIDPLLDKYSKMDYLYIYDDYQKINQYISKSNPEYLVTQNIDPAVLEVLKYEYPNYINYYNGFNFEYNALSKKPQKTQNIRTPYFYDKINFGTAGNWSFDLSHLMNGTDSMKYILTDSQSEFGPGMQVNTDELLEGRNNLITAIIGFKADSTFKDAKIVVSIEKEGKSSFYTAGSIGKFYTASEKWQKAAVALELINQIAEPGSLIKIYIWNPDKQQFYINDFEVKIYHGNEKRYGLTSPIRP